MHFWFSNEILRWFQLVQSCKNQAGSLFSLRSILKEWGTMEGWEWIHVCICVQSLIQRVLEFSQGDGGLSPCSATNAIGRPLASHIHPAKFPPSLITRIPLHSLEEVEMTWLTNIHSYVLTNLQPFSAVLCVCCKLAFAFCLPNWAFPLDYCGIWNRIWN